MYKGKRKCSQMFFFCLCKHAWLGAGRSWFVYGEKDYDLEYFCEECSSRLVRDHHFPESIIFSFIFEMISAISRLK